MKKSVLVRYVNGKSIRAENNNEITEQINFAVPLSMQKFVAKVMSGETGGSGAKNYIRALI